MAVGATATKLHMPSAGGRRPSLFHLAAVAVLCTVSYLIGIWHHGGFSASPAGGVASSVSIATTASVSCVSPTPTLLGGGGGGGDSSSSAARLRGAPYRGGDGGGVGPGAPHVRGVPGQVLRVHAVRGRRALAAVPAGPARVPGAALPVGGRAAPVPRAGAPGVPQPVPVADQPRRRVVRQRAAQGAHRREGGAELDPRRRRKVPVPRRRHHVPPRRRRVHRRHRQDHPPPRWIHPHRPRHRLWGSELGRILAVTQHPGHVLRAT
uniref:OSIGBa0111L12.6 protein n=1 Tax=Oryza sativa TaxID=4530 RepID=Q01IZ6_ORYSA|nr:OSIGBa0111L12.6 [Oryza sativa]